MTVNDQGEGHFLHQYFWGILQPDAAGTIPSGTLAQTIDRDFGSFNSFKKEFVENMTRAMAGTIDAKTDKAERVQGK